MITFRYKVLYPPFSKELQVMSKRELKEYYDWFMGQIPQRVNILSNFVTSSKGFEKWKADCKPSSLKLLGKWFSQNVDKRELTKKELDDIYLDAPDWFQKVEVEKWDLTDKSYSIAFDIGQYFSQVILRNNPNFKWKQIKAKKHADFGQPVIIGIGMAELNPINLITIIGLKLVEKGCTGSELLRMYLRWEKNLKGELYK